MSDSPTPDPPVEPGAPRGQIQTREVSRDEEGLRLDRWFKRHLPQSWLGALHKLGAYRPGPRQWQTGRSRRSGDPGQALRLPPGVTRYPSRDSKREMAELSERDTNEMRDMVIHRDDHVIALNKPPGLAVQGGTGTERHIDGMLDALQFEAASDRAWSTGSTRIPAVCC